MCSVPNCDRPRYSRTGLCKMHDLRVRRNGHTDLVRVVVAVGGPCAFQGCGRSARGRGYCTLHYRRYLKHKDPSFVDDRTIPIEQRLLEKIEINPVSGCWEFTGFKNKKGYGSIWHVENMDEAHRVSYTVFVAPIPEGIFVLHRCDNPPCINPEHLFLGTHLDNMADMRAKGRSKKFKKLVKNQENSNGL